MSRNPFQYLLPVSPEAFVARWPLVKRIALDLTLEGGDSHAVVAGRRCGKSSLLMAVAHQLRQPEAGEAGDWLALPLLFDLKGSFFDSVGAFFAQVLNEVRRRVDVTARRRPADAWPTPVRLDAGWFEGLADAPALSLRDFEDALGYILDQLDVAGKPVRLILLLDEMDEALDQPWTETLFDQLRALIYSGDVRESVRLMPAGSRRFLDQVSDRGSPLWNVLKLHYLRAFDEAGFRQLAARAEGLPDDVAQAVWRQSGGHPFLAQYLLHHLSESGIAGADVAAVDRLALRFLHERMADLDGWAQAAEIAGLRAYGVLAAVPDWVEEREIVRAVNDPSLNVKRGLSALCYHGLAIHDGGWEHYRRTGDLFKAWFDAHGMATLAKLDEAQRPEPAWPSQITAQTIGTLIVDPQAQVQVGDQVSVGDIEGSAGIAIGRKAVASSRQGVTADEMAELFEGIYRAIEGRSPDADVDKDEIKETVKKIENEAERGEEANPNKIERWLKTLETMAPDIFEVAVATWANPVAGLGLVLKKVAEKVKASTESATVDAPQAPAAGA